MGKESDLLRMLEPAVRPIGGLIRAPRESIEKQDFQAMLDQVQQQEQTDHTVESTSTEDDDTATRSNPDMLSRLGQIDRWNNSDLWRLMNSSQGD